MFEVLPWPVRHFTDLLPVLCQDVDFLAADFTVRLFQLWEASDVDSPFSFLSVEESVEPDPYKLT